MTCAFIYSHNEKVYIYACFVDFRKAIDSVWHVGLLKKLLQINVGGCFYNLIKSLYRKIPKISPSIYKPPKPVAQKNLR